MKKGILIFVAFLFGAFGFGHCLPLVWMTGDPIKVLMVVGLTLTPIVIICAYIKMPKEEQVKTPKRQKNIF